MKKDKLTDAISSIDQDIVENFVLLDAKLQKKAALRKSKMIKILSSAACLVLVLSISMSLAFDKENPITPNNNKPSTGGGSVPPASYHFESEDDLLLFLDLIRKDPSELKEYDLLEVYKDSPPPYFDISWVNPGELFEFPIEPHGMWIGVTEIPYAKEKFENIGYFTAKDSTSIEKFSHRFYRDYSGTETISYSVITIDGIAYCFDLRKTDEKQSGIKSFISYIRQGGKFYMKSELCGSEIKFYKMKNPNTHIYLEGFTYFEDYTVSMRIFVYNKEDIDKINLEQFVWRDYYEE